MTQETNDVRTPYQKAIHCGVVPLKEWRSMERRALGLTGFIRRQLSARAIFSGHMYAYRPLVTILSDSGSPLGIFYGNTNYRLRHIEPTSWNDDDGVWQPMDRVKLSTANDLQVWLTLKPDRWPIGH